MIKEYEKASKQVRKTGADLTRSLDRLEAARGGHEPAKVPSLHNQAHEALSRHESALDQLEKARQSYWLECAKEAEARLMELAPPLVDQVIAFRRATCNPGIVACPVDLLRQVLQVPRAPFDLTDRGVPDGIYVCPIVDRADEDICFNQRGHSRQIVDQDRMAAARGR